MYLRQIQRIRVAEHQKKIHWHQLGRSVPTFRHSRRLWFSSLFPLPLPNCSSSRRGTVSMASVLFVIIPRLDCHCSEDAKDDISAEKELASRKLFIDGYWINFCIARLKGYQINCHWIPRPRRLFQRRGGAKEPSAKTFPLICLERLLTGCQMPSEREEMHQWMWGKNHFPA